MSFFTTGPWLFFLLFFAIFAKSLWFFYYFSLYVFKPKIYKDNYNGKTALIVPVYNEQPDKLSDTIENVMKADGLNEIIFVNDGSDKGDVLLTLHKLQKSHNYGFKIVNLNNNVGKRQAQAEGIKAASEDTDVFVFMDSDTILQKDSITKLTKPMNDEEIGGTTACILVKNKDDNLLTKSISAMYWSASNIWRQGPSNLNFVQVTNGQLSCYRASIIKDIIQNYVSQDFLGVRCTLSDDRYLTHHIQTDYNKRIRYVKNSVVYTYVPNTIKGAYKMFLRWKRGSWRESVLVLKKTFKKPILIADIWANHLIQIMQTIVRVAVIILAITISPTILLYYIGIVILISLLYSFHMIVENIKEVPYKIIYSLGNEFIFSWTYLHALLTIKNQGKWGTR